MEGPFVNPILLTPDRFTPLVRTPWAGSTLARTIKSAVLKQYPRTDHRIGESWEFSADPELPSLTLDGQRSLIELVEQDPVACLSPSIFQEQGQTAHFEILVKLIQAAAPLSLQVHPADDDPHLGALECGKPESWLVLDAEAGAGLYLGFSRSMDRKQLRQALQDGAAAADLLQFVPVQKGDYFDLAPGVPHAIGPGVTLLEPQRIQAGKSGKTYRMWDWGRTYNQQGEEDPKGAPRPLHLDQALALVSPETQFGPAFVDSLRQRPERLSLGPETSLDRYPANAYYQVHWLRTADAVSLQVAGGQGYGILICLDGSLRARGQATSSLDIKQGYTALLPFAAWPIELHLEPGCEAALIGPPALRPEFRLSH